MLKVLPLPKLLLLLMPDAKLLLPLKVLPLPKLLAPLKLT